MVRAWFILSLNVEKNGGILILTFPLQLLTGILSYLRDSGLKRWKEGKTTEMLINGDKIVNTGFKNKIIYFQISRFLALIHRERTE